MPSSTSSSSPEPSASAAQRSRQLPGLRGAALMCLVAVALVAGWEALLAAHGVDPAQEPPANEHWLREYRRVQSGQADVVFVGSSRIQEAVSTQQVATALGIGPARVANLGTPFSSGLPVLRRMVEVDGFAGTVVVEVLPTHFFGGAPSHVDAVLAQLEQPALYADTEAAAATIWRQHVRSASGHSPLQAATGALAGAARSGEALPISGRLHDDRWYEVTVGDLAPADRIALAESESHQFLKPGSMPDAQTLNALLRSVADLVQTLENRGGHVIFVRMPSDLAVAEVEQSRFARAATWDKLALALPGRCLHWADNPALAGLRCYDGSHLDSRGAAIFGAEIAAVIAQRRQHPLPALKEAP